MLRWLLYVVLAIWAARLGRLVQARPSRGPVKDFDPGDGAPDPAAPPKPRQESPFAPGEIVDGEYEDVPASRRP